MSGPFDIDEFIIANGPEPDVKYLILGGATHLATIEDIEAVRDKIDKALEEWKR